MLTPPKRWLSPEDLVALGFERSRVVMMNEAHNGLRRSVRCRRVGRRVLHAAHLAGVRHLAMEALRPDFAARANESRAVPEDPVGYLAQPEMRDLIAAALELGWTLIDYEADSNLKPPGMARFSWDEMNWREDRQARNLVETLGDLGGTAKLFVWCGNGHLSKLRGGDWVPMGLRFSELSGVETFAIDQTRSVRFGDGHDPSMVLLLVACAGELAQHGGSAGFLAGDAPPEWPDFGVDAFVLSDDNDLS